MEVAGNIDLELVLFVEHTVVVVFVGHMDLVVVVVVVGHMDLKVVVVVVVGHMDLNVGHMDLQRLGLLWLRISGRWDILIWGLISCRIIVVIGLLLIINWLLWLHWCRLNIMLLWLHWCGLHCLNCRWGCVCHFRTIVNALAPNCLSLLFTKKKRKLYSRKVITSQLRLPPPPKKKNNKKNCF